MFSGLTIGWRIALGFIVVQTINAGTLLAVFGFVPDTGIATSIASAIEEQGVTTSEITRNTQQAAHGTHEVSRTIAEVNHAAGNTGSAAGQVLSSATALGGQADTLRREITRFLEEIQAA